LLAYTRQVAKVDQAQAASVVNEAMNRLAQALAGTVNATTDAHVAARELRPLRVGTKVFWPTDKPKKAA
jgi:hypothetical protein